MRGLTRKVVVVAGGGSSDAGPGIGARTAMRLAEEGSFVVVGDADLMAAERTVQAITDAGGVARACRVDVADAASAAALVQTALEAFGRLDGVHVNAADMASVAGPDSESDVLDLPLETWQSTIDVNLTGLMFMTRAAVPALLDAGGGSIVTMSSSAAFVGEPTRIAYATTKAGVGAMTRHVASRYGKQGIRCNAVAPGLVIRNDASEAALTARFGEPVRYTRHGRATDVAALVAFLLSDDGAWVNGQVLSINGGERLA